MSQVCILDYGSGNVGSVFNMVKHLGHEVVISNQPAAIKQASHLILPGVGAFGASMKKIKAKIPVSVLETEIKKVGKPFLGICVGMQVLADEGSEFGRYRGLGWISGQVTKLKNPHLPLPHIGWNDLKMKKVSALTQNFPNQLDFYFVHSYVLVPSDQTSIIAETTYGQQFCSIVNQDNIYGVQFHPEKSQKAGQLLMMNFLKL